MKVSVLVDPVEFVDFGQRVPLPVEEVVETSQAVPSAVWLQPLNGCSITLPKTLDLLPSLRCDNSLLILTSAGEDREGRRLGGVVRDTSTEVADVELVDELVQCGSEVEQAIANDHRPQRVERLDRTNAEAIFKTVSVAFNGDEALVEFPTSVEFFPEEAVVMLCAVQFCPGVVQISAHDLPSDIGCDLR
jgi:hypothetical protein